MKDESLKKPLKFISLAIVVSVVAWSFYIVGSPQLNRELRMDKHHIEDMYKAETAIEAFYKKNKSLPANMEILLNAAPDELPNYNDDKEQYEIASDLKNLFRRSENELFNIKYDLINKRSYKICSDFFHSWDKRKSQRHYWEESTPNKKWKHSDGNYCIETKVK